MQRTLEVIVLTNHATIERNEIWPPFATLAHLGRTSRGCFFGSLIVVATALGTMAQSVSVNAATVPAAPAQVALSVDNQAPKDRLEMHAPDDDHAAMPAGLAVAPEAGDAADPLVNARTATQAVAGASALDVTHISFYADTDHPKNGTYTIGELANICFTVQGILANDTLHMVVKDADGAIVSDQYASVVPHALYAHQCLPVPSSKLGFYRASVHLMRTNVTLAALRSRPGGYLTYVVLPDPTLRPQYPASQTFFGLQMPDSITYLAPNLGVRWILASWDYGWRYGEHQYPGQFLDRRTSNPNFPGATDAVSWKGGQWQMYEIPTLFMSPIPDAKANDWQTTPLPIIEDTASFMTAALTEGSPAGVTWWASFVRQAVQAFVDFHPNSRYDQRIYQITWEPRYKGSFDQITRIYQIAYPLIHAIDPLAIVAGPSASAMNNAQRTFELSRFFDANLLQYMDALAMHTYTVWPSETAQGHSQTDPNPRTPPGPYYTLAQSIRIAKQQIKSRLGHDIPMLSTEFGGNTKCPDSKLPCVSMELGQAQGLIRENLILMGEGFKVGVSFYGSDYVTPSEQGYYGLYYNLDPNHGWYHPDKVGPKPSAAAYAAMTYLLEGHHGVQPVTGLGSTAIGYAYASPTSTVLAVWDYYGSRTGVSVNTGADSVVVYDWMGNGHAVQTKSGVITVDLSKNPVYISGVSAAMWGDGSPGAKTSASARSSAATPSVKSAQPKALGAR